MSELREIRLSAELCAAAETRFAGRFGSIEELLTFLLRELTDPDSVELDESERQIIEERLKDLGYL
jgi:hypothetical protein